MSEATKRGGSGWAMRNIAVEATRPTCRVCMLAEERLKAHGDEVPLEAGVEWALRSFHPYVWGRPIKLVTDHQPLVWLMNADQKKNAHHHTIDAHLDLQALTSCGEAEAAIEVAFDEAGRNLRDSFINGAKVPSMRLLQIRGPLPWGGLGPTSRGPREGEAFGPRRGFELACCVDRMTGGRTSPRGGAFFPPAPERETERCSFSHFRFRFRFRFLELVFFIKSCPFIVLVPLAFCLKWPCLALP